jgi:hypothetical protein
MRVKIEQHVEFRTKELRRRRRKNVVMMNDDDVGCGCVFLLVLVGGSVPVLFNNINTRYRYRNRFKTNCSWYLLE